MASIQKRRPENTEGLFYVDESCIDCDTCRWMAPEFFTRIGEQSAVVRQPQSSADILRAAQALVACPTASIGVRENLPQIKQAVQSFPHQISENVYHCGFHSKNSFGAASYLIVRDTGNILIDSPRFARPLVENLEKLGGIKTLLLTHKDDVADHQKFSKYFGCERIMHVDDADTFPEIERTIQGHNPIELDHELTIIPVPGHTKGSMVFLYKDTFLFTGDHLAFSRSLQHFYAFRSACWYSWPELKKSMEELQAYRFSCILPGHGTPWQGTFKEAQTQMELCLKWMETV